MVGDGVQPAVYELKDDVHTFTEGLEISSNATLTGCGIVNGDLQVDPGGKVIVKCGTEGKITFNGAVTNNGGMAALHGNVLTVKGPLVNNGVIVFDLNGTNFQGGIIKLGTIVDAGSTSLQGVSSQGGSFSVQIQSDQRLTYQLQYTDSLGSNFWTKIGTPQPGNGGSLSLVDPAPSATGRFYQVVIGF